MDDRDLRVLAGTGSAPQQPRGSEDVHRADERGNGWATRRDHGVVHARGGDDQPGRRRGVAGYWGMAARRRSRSSMVPPVSRRRGGGHPRRRREQPGATHRVRHDHHHCRFGRRRACDEGLPLPEDGGPALDAQMNDPIGVALDRDGNILIADALYHRIRRVTPDGTITTIAGDGIPSFPAMAARPPRPPAVSDRRRARPRRQRVHRRCREPPHPAHRS